MKPTIWCLYGAFSNPLNGPYLFEAFEAFRSSSDRVDLICFLCKYGEHLHDDASTMLATRRPLMLYAQLGQQPLVRTTETSL